MTKEARSRGACWTCRLRRKKCDESHPACLACTSIAVPCYGYDPKPVWADGGARQKAKANELHLTVRELANKRRRQKRQDFNSGLVGGEFKNSVGHQDDDEMLLQLETKQAHSSRNKRPMKEINSETLHTPPSQVHALTVSKLDLSSRSLAQDVLQHDSQANLLMHYLDVVFPNHFPLYNPSTEEGGRGWLLVMILRAKSLYHAALSMAAYHQRKNDIRASGSKAPEKSAEDSFQKYHSLAIKELRLYLDAFQEQHHAQSLEGNTEVLACIVFLISLEVFNEDTESWQIHLKAVQNILPGLRKGCSKFINPAEPLSPSHRKAHHFFAAVICWYEIFSAATTGLKPWAPRSCLDEEIGFINLETVMGCKNSAVIAIREIALLNEWKSNTRSDEGAEVSELAERAAIIEKSLEDVLAQCFRSDGRFETLESLNSKEELDLASRQRNKRWEAPAFEAGSRAANISEITRIFACAALLYLNVVVWEPRAEHPRIKESVARTVTALGALHNRNTLGMLVFPICLAGCMATDQQMAFFRELSLEFGDVSDVKSGNLKKSFLIVEECWRLRQKTGVSDWLQAMESLNMKILLI